MKDQYRTVCSAPDTACVAEIAILQAEVALAIPGLDQSIRENAVVVEEVQP